MYTNDSSTVPSSSLYYDPDHRSTATNRKENSRDPSVCQFLPSVPVQTYGQETPIVPGTRWKIIARDDSRGKQGRRSRVRRDSTLRGKGAFWILRSWWTTTPHSNSGTSAPSGVRGPDPCG